MKKGFTLLEILLVIAAIGILAAIVIVAINPNRQLAQVRNTTRTSDLNTISKAVEQYLIDVGAYPTSLTGTLQEICAQNASDCTGYVDLQSELVPTYIAAIPQDPQVTGNGSGYEIAINSVNNKISITAPNAELDQTITLNGLSGVSVTDSFISFGNGQIISPNTIQTDATGNRYISGTFQGTLDFGGTVGTITSSGLDDGFVAKINTNNEIEWARRYGNSSNDLVNRMHTDTNGNVYLTGSFSGAISFGTDNYTSNGTRDGYLAVYNTNGNYQWSIHLTNFDTNSNNSFQDVTTDSSGNVYAIGQFESDGILDTLYTSAGSVDSFIARFSSVGAFEWVEQVGGTGIERLEGIAYDPTGNIIAVGTYSSTTNLGNAGNVTNNGFSDTMILKYSNTGAHQWTQIVSAAQEQIGNQVSVSNSGEVFVAGRFLGGVTFGSAGSVSSTGDWDGFITKISSLGVFEWVTQISGDDTETVNGLEYALDSDKVYITGDFSGTDVSIGVNLPQSIDGNTDGYVATINNSTGLVEDQRFYQGSGTSRVADIALDENENYFSLVDLQGAGDFGPAGNTTVSPSNRMIIVSSPSF